MTYQKQRTYRKDFYLYCVFIELLVYERGPYHSQHNMGTSAFFLFFWGGEVLLDTDKTFLK